MRRTKFEGMVLDLTRLSEGEPFVLKDLIVHEIEQSHNRTHAICLSCNKLQNIYREQQCFMCFRLSTTPTEIRDYIVSLYTSPCVFCGDIDSIKHFDHINIFDKTACILDLVTEPLNTIQIEVTKCQLLCISCHYKVTQFEIRNGFIRRKKKLNKRRASGEDVTKEWECAFKDYEEALTPFYRALRGEIGD